MTKTAERNGVPLYIAPRAHKFRVLGDVGIHEKAGADFWTAVAAAMEEHFRKGEFTEGAVEAVRTIGEKLAAHFPRRADDRDELPNVIDHDDEDWTLSAQGFGASVVRTTNAFLKMFPPARVKECRMSG